MPEYTVHLYETVSTAVTVEAEDADHASEIVYDSPDMPGSITHGAFGRASVDEDKEWIISAITDEGGEEVYTESDDALSSYITNAEKRLIAADADGRWSRWSFQEQARYLATGDPRGGA